MTLTTRFVGRAIACLALAGVPLAAFAAHPLVTEDTGTQGADNFEIENGAGRARSAGSSVFSYQPQLSYGLTPATDLIVQATWLRTRAPDGATDHGFGDTAFDAKWRYYGASPLSLAVRAGLIVATGQRDLGMPHGDVAPHVNLVATWDAAPLTVHGNVEYTQIPADTGQRPQQVRVSSAVMWVTPNDRLILTGEVGVQNDTDPTRRAWTGSVLGGAIYTIRPGLDADVGYQTTVKARTRVNQWLVGLTYRFAL